MISGTEPSNGGSAKRNPSQKSGKSGGKFNSNSSRRGTVNSAGSRWSLHSIFFGNRRNNNENNRIDGKTAKHRKKTDQLSRSDNDMQESLSLVSNGPDGTNEITVAQNNSDGLTAIATDKMSVNSAAQTQITNTLADSVVATTKRKLSSGSKNSSVSQSHSMNSQLKECPLCFFKQPRNNFPVLTNCSHTACTQCLVQYLTTEINESRVLMSCAECDEAMHPNDIYKLLKPAVLAKYEEFSVRRALMLDPDTRWCPAPDCSYALIAYNCAACPMLQCERADCGATFCYHCKMPWHQRQTCDEARRMRNQSRRSQNNERNRRVSDRNNAIMTGSDEIDSQSSRRDSIRLCDAKACPKCGTFIVKMNDGSCNHMVCALCQAEFCWLCLKEISDLHYLSPSGCTFWGRRPWSRKKKLLWQLGMLVGAPLGIALVAGIAIPGIIFSVPIIVGRAINSRLSLSRLGKHKRRSLVAMGVFGSLLVSPVLAAIAVGIGVPLLLVYVYGVVPVSLCRGGRCGIISTAGELLENMDEYERQRFVQLRVRQIYTDNKDTGDTGRGEFPAADEYMPSGSNQWRSDRSEQGSAVHSFVQHSVGGQSGSMLNRAGSRGAHDATSMLTGVSIGSSATANVLDPQNAHAHHNITSHGAQSHANGHQSLQSNAVAGNSGGVNLQVQAEVLSVSNSQNNEKISSAGYVGSFKKSAHFGRNRRPSMDSFNTAGSHLATQSQHQTSQHTSTPSGTVLASGTGNLVHSSGAGNLADFDRSSTKAVAPSQLNCSHYCCRDDEKSVHTVASTEGQKVEQNNQENASMRVHAASLMETKSCGCVSIANGDSLSMRACAGSIGPDNVSQRQVTVNPGYGTGAPPHGGHRTEPDGPLREECVDANRNGAKMASGRRDSSAPPASVSGRSKSVSYFGLTSGRGETSETERDSSDAKQPLLYTTVSQNQHQHKAPSLPPPTLSSQNRGRSNTPAEGGHRNPTVIPTSSTVTDGMNDGEFMLMSADAFAQMHGGDMSAVVRQSNRQWPSMSALLNVQSMGEAGAAFLHNIWQPGQTNSKIHYHNQSNSVARTKGHGRAVAASVKRSATEECERPIPQIARKTTAPSTSQPQNTRCASKTTGASSWSLPLQCRNLSGHSVDKSGIKTEIVHECVHRPARANSALNFTPLDGGEFLPREKLFASGDVECGGKDVKKGGISGAASNKGIWPHFSRFWPRQSK